MMKFYNALQMDPSILKRKIAASDTRQEKAYYWTAIAVRSVLIVAFAIVFISLLSGVFGADNTPLAVALFCMMLGIRFVNFDYCIGDSLITLAAVLGDPGVCAQYRGSGPAGLFDSAALCRFSCGALYDNPAPGNGQWRFIQLCLHLSDRKSRLWGGPGQTRRFGAGQAI